MLKNDRQLGGSVLLQKLDQLMTTPGYIMLIMALTALSNILGLELPVYTAFVAIFVNC